MIITVRLKSIWSGKIFLLASLDVLNASKNFEYQTNLSNGVFLYIEWTIFFATGFAHSAISLQLIQYALGLDLLCNLFLVAETYNATIAQIKLDLGLLILGAATAPLMLETEDLADFAEDQRHDSFQILTAVD